MMKKRTFWKSVYADCKFLLQVLWGGFMFPVCSHLVFMLGLLKAGAPKLCSVGHMWFWTVSNAAPQVINVCSVV